MPGRRIAALGAAALFAGCGTSTGISNEASGGDEDGQYFFETVRELAERAEPFVAGQPTTVTEAVPCAKAPGRAKAIISGSVLSVEPGTATIWGDDEDEVTYTEFDDGRANERNVVMAVEADSQLSATGASDAVTIVKVRMGVLGGADPEMFMASLAGLDAVVLLLDQLPDGKHVGDYYPMLGGAGVGIVEPDGSLAFPGLQGGDDRFLARTLTKKDLFELCP